MMEVREQLEPVAPLNYSHVIDFCLTFSGTVFRGAILFTFPSTVYEGSHFTTSLPHVYIVLSSSHSSDFEVASHYRFIVLP